MILLVLASLASAQQEIPLYAGRGPVPVHVPASYEPGTPTPLIILLHGYSSNAERLEGYVEFEPMSDTRGFLLAKPDGLRNPIGQRFWNGTDACCDWFGDTDDSGYLRDLIQAASERFSVDPRRVFVFGHSNGGFMAHRMGCDGADVVAAIASFGAATWDDPAKCAPAAPVHALEIHGTSDDRFSYAGGCVAGNRCYPSATGTAEIWAELNHCATTEVPPREIDLTAEIPGPDTTSLAYEECDPGGSSALWTVHSAPHHPRLSPAFNDAVIQYLLAHPKPSDIACESVVGMRARCNPGGTLGVTVEFVDDAHDRKTVDLNVDGTLRVARVHGPHAKLILNGQTSGPHAIRLLDPQGCADDVVVSCDE